MDDHIVEDTVHQEDSHIFNGSGTTETGMQEIIADQGYVLTPIHTSSNQTPSSSPFIQLDGPVDKRTGSSCEQGLSSVNIFNHKPDVAHPVDSSSNQNKDAGKQSARLLLSRWNSIQELMEYGASTFKDAASNCGSIPDTQCQSEEISQSDSIKVPSYDQTDT